MTDTITVGSRYRNSSGEYEVLAVDGMWATVRYEDGTEKRHLLAALQIHWENDQAAAEAAAVEARKAPRTRARTPKPKTPFPAAETCLLIAVIIRNLHAEKPDPETYVTRQEIVAALLEDNTGQRLIADAHKALFYRSEEWIAGSMLDHFGQEMGSRNSTFSDQFDREMLDASWAYRPRNGQ